MENYNQLNYQESLEAAKQGNPQAQYQLGLCYENGEGVSVDLDKAFEWFQKAAELGNIDAQNSLGCCYYNAEGTSQDFSKAAQWFQKAAEQNHDFAQANLGFCYYYGNGVIQNYERATSLFKKAAAQGNAEAIQMLDTIDNEKQKSIRKEGWIGMFWGALWLIGGLLVTILTYRAVAETGGRYVIAYGAIIFGAVKIIKGFIDIL